MSKKGAGSAPAAEVEKDGEGEAEPTPRPAPATRQKALRLSQDHPRAKPADEEEAQDRADEEAVKDKVQAKKTADKIGQVEEIEHAPYASDQSVTQCFGMPIIEAYGGKVEDLPRFHFKRWYFGLKIIVDTFRSDKEYEAAQVEERRALAHKFGHRYAALGPFHSRYPHGDPEMREKYPSLVEQLEEKG